MFNPRLERVVGGREDGERPFAGEVVDDGGRVVLRDGDRGEERGEVRVRGEDLREGLVVRDRLVSRHRGGVVAGRGFGFTVRVRVFSPSLARLRRPGSDQGGGGERGEGEFVEGGHRAVCVKRLKKTGRRGCAG